MKKQSVSFWLWQIPIGATWFFAGASAEYGNYLFAGGFAFIALMGVGCLFNERPHAVLGGAEHPPQDYKRWCSDIGADDPTIPVANTQARGDTRAADTTTAQPKDYAP